MVRVVVNFGNLAFNISRVTLHQHRLLRFIGRDTVEQGLERFDPIAENGVVFPSTGPWWAPASNQGYLACPATRGVCP